MSLGPQFGKLYHGTRAFIPDGEVVRPTQGVMGPGAHAADTVDQANNYAHSRISIRDKYEVLASGLDPSKPQQAQMFAPVYEVEPVSSEEDFEEYKGNLTDAPAWRHVRSGSNEGQGHHDFKDPKGMKIKGIHTYVSHDGTDIGTV